jgi:hypothetical protein
LAAQQVFEKSCIVCFAFLIFQPRSVKLRAMFRYVILFVSIAWASLLLLSWSGPTETVAQPTPVVNNAS